ncbi:MAG: hypothetical protein ABR511_11025 [Acidimicrobiales bacterium]
MHSHITLVLWHHDEHEHPLPPVELRGGEEREARVTFRESDDESTRLVGCPECVANLLRGTAERIEALLADDRWTPA